MRFSLRVRAFEGSFTVGAKTQYVFAKNQKFLITKTVMFSYQPLVSSVQKMFFTLAPTRYMKIFNEFFVEMF